MKDLTISTFRHTTSNELGKEQVYSPDSGSLYCVKGVTVCRNSKSIPRLSVFTVANSHRPSFIILERVHIKQSFKLKSSFDRIATCWHAIHENCLTPGLNN